ncbi:hypothetical protein OR573_00750 [Halomonas sp. CH40]
MHTRGKKRRADYLLSFQKNQPIAVIEAKDNKHSLGDGMQQALTEFPSSDALLDGYCQYKKMPVARTVVEGGLN